jgi:hypothetical protein
MGNNAKNQLLSDCYGRLMDIVKRLDRFVSDNKANDNYLSIQHDFKQLHADVKELFIYHDPQDKDLQYFIQRMESLGNLFTKVEPSISSFI